MLELSLNQAKSHFLTNFGLCGIIQLLIIKAILIKVPQV